MNTTIIVDEIIETNQNTTPGEFLSAARLEKGYTIDYVAGKLHLRVRTLELLEADDYKSLPEPVFIKGYIRAYSKFLGVSPEPLLDTFNQTYRSDRHPERTLWQSRRETNHAEHAIRWVTGFFALIVLVAVAMWWYKNKDNEPLFPTNTTSANNTSNKSETEIRLTDLSKMRSLLSSNSQLDSLEKTGG